MRPVYYYGARHSYAYYPTSWTDRDTGVSYDKGYYDENGQRYDHVSFEENGRYKNVLCHCPYCDQETLLDLSADDAAARYLKCPHCGGPMELRSELDAIVRGAPGNTHVYRSEESLKNAFPKKKKKNRLWLIVAVLILLSGLGKRIGEKRAENNPPLPGTQLQQIETAQNATPQYGSNVFLERQEDGAYHVVTDVLRANKILYFDRDADSYYDEGSDCWLWYNTDVEQPLWQYWYEGISSDYGDYGWMEHGPDGWFIEEANGKWVPVPEKYDTAGLWWIG